METSNSWPFSNWNWKQLAWYALGILLAILILAFLTDLLYISISPLGTSQGYSSQVQLPPQISPLPPDESGYDFWLNRIENVPNPIVRRIDILIEGSALTLDLSLVVDPNHPFVNDMTQGRLEDDMIPFVQVVFGTVEVQGYPLDAADFSPPSLLIDPGNRRATITFHASRRINWSPWVNIDRLDTGDGFVPALDEVVIEIKGYRFHTLYPTPIAANENRVVFQAEMSEILSYVSVLTKSLPQTADNTGSTPVSATPSRQAFLARLGDILGNIPFVSTVLFSLVEVLPLLLFLRFVFRSDEHSGFILQLAQGLMSLLVFHFVLYMLRGVNEMMQASTLLDRASDLIARAIVPYLHLPIYPRLGSGADRIGVLILGVILPLVFVQRIYQGANQRHLLASSLSFFLGSFIFVGFLGGMAYLLNEQILLPTNGILEIPLWLLSVTISSFLILLIFILLHVLYRKLAFAPPRPAAVMLVSWLVISMGLLSAYLDYIPDARRVEPIAWYVVSVLLGALLLYGLYRVVHFVIQQSIPGFALSRRIIILLSLVGLSLVLPMSRLIDPIDQAAFPWLTIILGFQVDNFITYIWIIGVIWLLYLDGQAGAQISPSVRVVGVLGASALFFSPTAFWLYIPVRFLLGLLLLSYIVQSATIWTKLEPLYLRVVSYREHLLEQTVNLKTARSTFWDFRKKTAEKLASGEISPKEFEEKILKRKQEIEELNQKASIEQMSYSDIALDFGPHRTAWANGVHGAWWGLLLALPWIGLFLYEFMTSALPSQYYPLWFFSLNFFSVMARWAGMGFVFGYFYPYLYGKNGLQKGFLLFLVFVLPTLPLAAIYNNSPVEWQATLLWILQVFIHCMLLGLIAFDYMIVRKERQGWQMLFEIHGFTYLGLSLSTILAAISAAVITLLTNQTTNLFGLALKFLVPQLPLDSP